jgi:hypothetical protein
MTEDNTQPIRVIRIRKRRDKKNKQFITPHCCREMEYFASVYLSMDIYRDGGDKKVPKWHVRTWDESYQCKSEREAKFCPHCGTPVPKVVPSNYKGKICKVTDGGYYCDTCGERLMACKCKPSEFAWKAEEKVI